MAQYLRWMKNGRKEEEAYFKPRSRSLDPKALENSGIKALQMRVRNLVYISKKCQQKNKVVLNFWLNACFVGFRTITSEEDNNISVKTLGANFEQHGHQS